MMILTLLATCFLFVLADFVVGNMDLSLIRHIDRLIGKQAHEDIHTALHGDKENGLISSAMQAHGAVMQPVFKSIGNKEVGGVLMGIMGFDSFLVDLLPDGIRGIRVLIENSCGDQYTYELDGNRVSSFSQLNTYCIILFTSPLSSSSTLT